LGHGRSYAFDFTNSATKGLADEDEHKVNRV